MKVTLSLATLMIAASISLANAQTELAIANHTGSCPNCSMKDQKILKLQAELAAMKGETPRNTLPTTGLQAEEVPIIPEAAAIIGGTDLTYTVQPGDGLMKIARKTGSKASDIAAVNNMAMDDIIRPGQVLKLPTGATMTATAPKASPIEEAPRPTQQPKTYTIKEGETYYSISRRMKIPLDELMAANPKAPANRLYTGRVIQLPVKGEVPAPAPVEAPLETIRETAVESTPDTTLAAENALEATTDDTPVVDATPAPATQKKIIAVSVDEEISYGDFASKYGTNTDRLNSLNDLSLTSATILAKGSELYVPTE